MLVLLAAVAILLAVAARAAADPVTDEGPVELDAESAEVVAQPDVVDDPTSDGSIDQLESIGVAGAAGVEDWIEEQARHQRPSPWGRVDLQLSLLRRDDAPGLTAPHVFDELWLELIWRR